LRVSPARFSCAFLLRVSPARFSYAFLLRLPSAGFRVASPPSAGRLHAGWRLRGRIVAAVGKIQAAHTKFFPGAFVRQGGKTSNFLYLCPN
ncbi:hypothetical protein, partial [Alistipes sp.]|uniref:hypothetical protein n=1 Tax=Alistipes sp. TaxID=1872444 RepID=UPI003993A366